MDMSKVSNTSLINLEHLAPISFQFSTSNKIYEMKGNSSKENCIMYMKRIVFKLHGDNVCISLEFILIDKQIKLTYNIIFVNKNKQLFTGVLVARKWK